MTEVVTQPKVFVSYAHVHAAWAAAFTGRLQESGAQVWSVDWDVPNGAQWRDAVENGLRESDVIVILVDPNTLEQPNALFELGVALAGNKVVVPVVAKDVGVSELPVPIERVLFLERGAPGTTANELIDKLRDERFGSLSSVASR